MTRIVTILVVNLLYFAFLWDVAAASGIGYAQNPVTYTLGNPITPNTASFTGTPTNFSISPALPDGMAIEPKSGTIQGRPTQIIDTTTYTVSAKLPQGPITGSLTLGIGDATIAYYVDDTNGNDSWDGHTPSTAWRSLQKVNNTPLKPGTSVRFKRGGVWRGQLRIQSGSAAAALYYDAYGTGPSPVILGSMNARNPSSWQAIGGNLWQSTATFQPQPGYTNGLPYNNANDVGNIIYGPTGTQQFGLVNPPKTGVEKWSQNLLNNPGDFFFRTTDYRVILYSTSNPAMAFPGIELAIDADLMNITFASHAYVQHLALRYGAGCGINGWSTSNLTFRDLDISYIGGGNLGGSGTRYGNGIQFWTNTRNNLVERSRIWQIYDDGITNQASANGAVQYNITYRNNIIWNSAGTCIGMWENGANSTMSNIYVYNNTCVSPNGWAVNQRPSGNHQFSLVVGMTPPNFIGYNISFMNNEFVNIKGCNILAQGTYYSWKYTLNMDYDDFLRDPSLGGVSNTVVCESSDGKYQKISRWAPAFPVETHGIEAQPAFANATTGDFHSITGSPIINAGANLTSVGVVLDFDRKPRPATGAFDIGAFQH